MDRNATSSWVSSQNHSKFTQNALPVTSRTTLHESRLSPTATPGGPLLLCFSEKLVAVLQGDQSPDNVTFRHFPDGSRHSSAALGMLSVTHIMPVLVLNTWNNILQQNLTRGQSNLTRSASRGAHSPVRVTPGGRNLYHWIPGVGVPISVP